MVIVCTATGMKKTTKMLLIMLIMCLYRLINTFDFKEATANRSPSVQGGFQAAGLCVAIAFGLVGGALVGKCKYSKAGKLC